jgi:hypothetical protein
LVTANCRTHPASFAEKMARRTSEVGASAATGPSNGFTGRLGHGAGALLILSFASFTATSFGERRMPGC